MNTTVTYRVITINRAKEIIRSTDAENFIGALNIVAKCKAAAEASNWKTFVNDNAIYFYPNYIVRKNTALAGAHVTSFSMINGKKSDGGEYFFTYIKKVA